MKDILKTDKKAQDEIHAIKDDIKDIVKRVGNLKDESLNVLYENSGDLISQMSELKDKISAQGQDSASKIYCSIEKNPLKGALYCFAAGIAVALFLRK